MNPSTLTLRPVSTGFTIGAGASLLAAASVVALATGSTTAYLLAAAVVALAGLAYLAAWTPPSVVVALGIGATVFSGHSERLGFPIGPDRLLVAAGIGALVLGLPGAAPERTIVWRPLHALLAATAAYAAVSALNAGTLTDEEALFGLLDRLGLVPFLVFTLAPLLFGSARSRNALLAVLTGVGAYLSLTALAEGLGLDGLVWPTYILDPAVGIHAERARGPFTEAVANGLALYGCGVGAAVAAYSWKDRPTARILAGLVALLCVVGTIFTLTRSVWVATVAATVVAVLVNSRTRAVMVPIVAVGVLAIVAALVLVPGFSDLAEDRSSSQRPLWDRYNTNLAGLRAVEDEPMFGIGWQRWTAESAEYLRLADDYPLTGADIQIHNVPLSHAAELGLVGGTLWLLSFLAAIGAAVLRPGPAELDPWRLGLVALAIHWGVVAAFAPLSYAFPNLLLWTWAGVCSIGHLSRPVAGTEPSAAA